MQLSISSPVVTLHPGSHGPWEVNATVEDLATVADFDVSSHQSHNWIRSANRLVHKTFWPPPTRPARPSCRSVALTTPSGNTSTTWKPSPPYAPTWVLHSGSYSARGIHNHGHVATS